MPFGQQQQRDQQEKPTRMKWDGTPKRATEIADWGRDEALLPIVAVTPPSRDAAPGTPEAGWQVKAKVAVSVEFGGGEQWVDVPEGATISNTNTGPTAWIDPVLSVTTPRGSAAAFSKE